MGHHEVDIPVIDGNLIDKERVRILDLGPGRIVVAGVEDEGNLIAGREFIVRDMVAGCRGRSKGSRGSPSVAFTFPDRSCCSTRLQSGPCRSVRDRQLRWRASRATTRRCGVLTRCRADRPQSPDRCPMPSKHRCPTLLHLLAEGCGDGARLAVEHWRQSHTPGSCGLTAWMCMSIMCDFPHEEVDYQGHERQIILPRHSSVVKDPGRPDSQPPETDFRSEARAAIQERSLRRPSQMKRPAMKAKEP